MPPNVVTAISVAPADPAGAIAVICVGLFTTYEVAATAPKRTAVAPLKLVPVIVTLVPPAIVPLLGDAPLTVAAAKAELVNVNATDADVPPGEAIAKATLPIPLEFGVTTVICVGLTTEGETPGSPEKVTAVAPVKFEPVIVNVVPPLFAADVGDIDVMTGSGFAT